MKDIKKASLFLLVFLLGACHTTGPAVPESLEDAGREKVWNTVVILDDAITEKFAIESTLAKRTPTGTVEAWARLHNLSDQPVQVEASTQFFGMDKAPVEPATAWKRLYFTPNGTVSYSEKSVKKEANHYLIQIRAVKEELKSEK
ncbi:MAG: hypothetical protein ACE5GM_04405 [bacterium]